MVTAMLAIFKAGGAYLPLDPSYPRERLSFILNDAQVGVVITQSGYLSLFSEQPIHAVCIDNDWEKTMQLSVVNGNISPESLAYVIYTSGSTGNPKGVMITHESLCNFVRLADSVLDVASTDVYMQTASIAYALSVRQLMIPLAKGATVVLANAEQMRDPLMLFQLIKRKGVTLMDMVPSFWRTCIYRLAELPEEERKDLLDNSLRRIVSIGEPLNSDIPYDWALLFGHKTKMVNIFGQTETTGVVATYSIPNEPPAKAGIVPIGHSIPKTKLYLLDANLQPAPVGGIGELCVSNPCLARGYLNRPDLTAEKFIPNPFNDGFNSRLYRTGDMALQREDGSIEFLGRGDHQVKIRGQRLELGEVESVIQRHKNVRECAVMVRGDLSDNKYLAAYIVAGDKHLSAAELQRFVRDTLPEYMVPSAFVFLDEMPLAPNGKLNRLALPDPATIVSNVPISHLIEKPRNQIEQTLATIWQDLMDLDSVGIHDDFFDLGGHSLTAVRLFSRIEDEFGMRFPATAVLQAPTIFRLAEMLQHGGLTKDTHVLIPIQMHGERQPFFCVHGVGGGVLGYRDLVHALGDDQPFYGFQAIGQDDPEICDPSIEIMASRYIDSMRSLQPHGPYRLGGYCFGGVVAYEMACQLERQGEQVSLLALFEGFLPEIKNAREPLSKRIYAVLRHIPSWIKDYANMNPAEIRYRIRSTFNKLGSKLKRQPEMEWQARVEEILDMDISTVPDRNVKLTQVHSRAFHKYEPHRYGGTVTLFRARHRSFNEVVFGSLDPKMGWEEWAVGGVDVKLVDGFHRNIHLPPYVNSLATELNHCLEMESIKEQQHELQ
jgi:aspartate racemase